MSDLFLKFLEKRYRYLEDLIAAKQKALVNAPEGKLRISGNGDYPSYYFIGQDSKAPGKYMKKENTGTARALAQKDYDQRIISAARRELTALSKLMSIQNASVEDIFGQMPVKRQNLVTPFRPTDEPFVAQWLDRHYEPMGFDENAPVIKSLSGLRVRSKSERLWADSLDKFEVPFIYEPPLYLEGHGWIRPDFLALNVRLRKEFYIENLGMMEIASYAESNVMKISAYEDNGYLLGDRLLITMETVSHPVNSGEIEDIIKKYLI